MIRYLKARGTYVLFNSNGILLNAKRAQELTAALSKCPDAGDLVATLESVRDFPAAQRQSELRQLLDAVRPLKPRYACQIGVYGGGALGAAGLPLQSE